MPTLALTLVAEQLASYIAQQCRICAIQSNLTPAVWPVRSLDSVRTYLAQMPGVPCRPRAGRSGTGGAC